MRFKEKNNDNNKKTYKEIILEVSVASKLAPGIVHNVMDLLIRPRT